jgi:hypothetical protein
MVALDERQLDVLARLLDDLDEVDTNESEPGDIDRESEVAEAPVMRHHEETLSTVEPIYVNPNGGLASPLKEKQ